MTADLPFLKHLACSDLPTSDGGTMQLQGQIPERFAMALHRAMLRLRPEHVVEIGMATGTSSLAILSAMEAQGHGRLTTVDPNQSGSWRGVGIRAVANAGLSGRQMLIEEPDYLALPKLVDAGVRCQFAYVDGWHTFDYVALDIFFIDKMLDPGGVIGFNDCAWPAVRKALRYLTTHRKYRPFDVGLSRFTGRTRFHTAANVFRMHSPADRYFQKVEEWEPAWTYFRRF